MDFDTQVKLAIYRHFATTAVRPSAVTVAAQLNVEPQAVLDAFHRLRAQRMLVLEEDSESIRMAPPFSGVPTQHVVTADGQLYFANCAWDALGVVAALHKPAVVHSRCEGSAEPLRLRVGLDGPEASDWVFHCLVPAAQWWADIVFT